MGSGGGKGEKMAERLTNRDKEIPLPNPDNAVFWARVQEKLARYEDAEADGRLIVLPAKVRDTVYLVYSDGTLAEHKISFISSGYNNEFQFHFEHMTGCAGMNDFGIWIFTSREEAETALERMKKDG